MKIVKDIVIGSIVAGIGYIAYKNKDLIKAEVKKIQVKVIEEVNKVVNVKEEVVKEEVKEEIKEIK